MSGAFDLTKPSDLLEKLDHEMMGFGADPNNSYAAINALRDAYHLREWVWHDRLQHNPALLTQIIGSAGNKKDAWNSWVNSSFVNFPIVRDICNGSKHFEPGDKVKGYLKAGLISHGPCQRCSELLENPVSTISSAELR